MNENQDAEKSIEAVLKLLKDNQHNDRWIEGEELDEASSDLGGRYVLNVLSDRGHEIKMRLGRTPGVVTFTWKYFGGPKAN